jgi:inositol-phosphate phosphatase/L-galactose 1-phosphate phosphatase/histidinol-phosphatase
MAFNSELSNGVEDSKLDHFAQVVNMVANSAGEVIQKYCRKKFDILIDKEDLSKPL